jgi:choline dehydrogenase-like flavoprotein
LPSLARGGLSNVWGASVLPFAASDIDDWPINMIDLRPHYEAVSRMLDISSRPGGTLETLFPNYGQVCERLIPGMQTGKLLSDLESKSLQLQDEGIYFGHSRIALNRSSGAESECIRCAQCLLGCPRRLIFNASGILQQLQTDSNFQYRNNIVVQKLEQAEGRVVIHALDRKDGSTLQFEARRVFLGAGVLPTARILLDSLGAYDQVITARDSEYFLFPLLRYRNTSKVTTEELYTLSQAFIEIANRQVSERGVHLQVYSYSEAIRSGVQDQLGPLYGLFKPVIENQLGRMLLVQGFLHSDVSPTLDITLVRNGMDEPAKLNIQGRCSDESQQLVKRVCKFLFKNRSLLRAIPLTPLLQVANPGRSFHIGGTFPMKTKPGKFETDRLGALHGFQGVYIIDASTFPSVPASTITFSVMANAHRIASNAA